MDLAFVFLGEPMLQELVITHAMIIPMTYAGAGKPNHEYPASRYNFRFKSVYRFEGQ